MKYFLVVSFLSIGLMSFSLVKESDILLMMPTQYQVDVLPDQNKEQILTEQLSVAMTNYCETSDKWSLINLLDF